MIFNPLDIPGFLPKDATKTCTPNVPIPHVWRFTQIPFTYARFLLLKPEFYTSVSVIVNGDIVHSNVQYTRQCLNKTSRYPYIDSSSLPGVRLRQPHFRIVNGVTWPPPRWRASLSLGTPSCTYDDESLWIRPINKNTQRCISFKDRFAKDNADHEARGKYRKDRDAFRKSARFIKPINSNGL